VHEADAEDWQPPEPIDVVLAELMETGLLHEPMAAAARNVHRWGSKPRAMVPFAARLLVEGVQVGDRFLRYHAPLPGFRSSGAGRAMTDAAAYFSCDFLAAPPPEGVDASFALRARGEGEVDALRLRTQTLVAERVPLETGPAYCTPVVLPLAEPVRVRAGMALRGRLRYAFAFDARPIEYELEAGPP
jgi:predicted RNA methylase